MIDSRISYHFLKTSLFNFFFVQTKNEEQLSVLFYELPGSRIVCAVEKSILRNKSILSMVPHTNGTPELAA